MKYLTIILIVIIIAGAMYYFSSHSGNQKASLGVSTEVTPAVTLGVQTKTSGCVVNGPLQDSACTPGAIFPNITKDQICQLGYAKSVRNVPAEEKRQVYEEYGITHHKAGEYEVDHLISLELGGSNAISNLWPEAANPTPGFHEKDRMENYLHDQVCNGSLSLQQAQQEISTNWLHFWNTAGQP